MCLNSGELLHGATGPVPRGPAQARTLASPPAPLPPSEALPPGQARTWSPLFILEHGVYTEATDLQQSGLLKLKQLRVSLPLR